MVFLDALLLGDAQQQVIEIHHFGALVLKRHLHVAGRIGLHLACQPLPLPGRQRVGQVRALLDLQGAAQITVLDEAGRVQQHLSTESAKVTLNVSRLRMGTYLIKVVLADGRLISQIVQIRR